MIKKLKNLYRTIITNQSHLIRQTKELEWAHVFNHSINGKHHLAELDLNIGRWAGNFSLFYVLNRIMSDFQPKRIVEFGLGESSRFIMAFKDTYSFEYLAIEHNSSWKEAFLEKNSNFDEKHIHTTEMVIKPHQSHQYNSYAHVVENQFVQNADFYLIDGPIGTSRFSRFDIASIVQDFPSNKEFIILIDDYNRFGEQETGKFILDTLKSNKFTFHYSVFSGIKDQLLICSENFRFLTTV